jgi:hypothetical protein
METQVVETKIEEVKAPIRKKKEVAAPAVKAETKKNFMKGMLLNAPDGLTWAQIQEALVAKYGSAPKKRSALYQLLDGMNWEKKVGDKKIATYVIKLEAAAVAISEAPATA